MESLTKNNQNLEVLEKMVEKFFSPKKMISYKELTEGFFNVAYEIGLSDATFVILKIAPPKDVRVMRYEKNIMKSEVEAMEMANRKETIPLPKILGYDNTKTICSSEYFFMEKLQGESLNSIKETLTQEQINAIYETSGEINRKIHEIVCPVFGYPGQEEYQGDNWFMVFEKMLKGALLDAKDGNVDLKISVDEMWSLYKKDQAIFEEIRVPKLVHWDCWDGNIFIKDAKVTGLIDWERCLWADPLMEVGFRTYDKNESFLKGYGKTNLTKNEYKRALWYDLYLCILMSLECEYRKYETMDMYHWAVGLLQKQFDELKKEA